MRIPGKRRKRPYPTRRCLRAQTGPIFLAYRSNEVLRKLTARVKATEPEFAFVSEDGIGHRGWEISNQEEVQQIEQAFSKIDSIYIRRTAINRAASAVKVGLKRRAEHPGLRRNRRIQLFPFRVVPG